MEKPVDNKPRKRIVIEETDSEEENVAFNNNHSLYSIVT
jgi:hypothetical protein